MHLATEHRVHYPVFEIIPVNTRDSSVVLHSYQNAAALEIGQRHHFLRELFRAQIGVALELHSGVLPVGDVLEQF